ncbi:hypothetical protein [Schinkia azotoformans]|uniref:hypothetical protein n=1 Tax=Schinkia azotoformans TaxID=1454 RepID=UPI002DB9EC21|nr:hypothetical protein [Schinkia azotoformans]MEC1786068.1 hypothetical protein [Schinkia azotoformans]MED4420104.1 hypothetical protein [Schinkia azotoformans]
MRKTPKTKWNYYGKPKKNDKQSFEDMMQAFKKDSKDKIRTLKNREEGKPKLKVKKENDKYEE